MQKQNNEIARKYDNLAQMVSSVREKLGLSQSGLAKKCNLTVEEIENIESGQELTEDYMKQAILEGNTDNLRCPSCGSKLVTRVARMYDLEDNLVLTPKAHCTKCPFQII